ncbi:hypothetical protein FB45DRAFT_877371 [Roridomyces roridus]|uniref:Uncharacterized protein n=1 Tax=Roridomyces roridus TaxID=1738132 RepID=A0AAD7B1W1_9AGAR|nr:hypothetical protein FB45DRAFT_877371 [Roridomyces roridus]
MLGGEIEERAVEKGLGRRQDEGGKQKEIEQMGKEPNKVQRIESHLVKERIIMLPGPTPRTRYQTAELHRESLEREPFMSVTQRRAVPIVDRAAWRRPNDRSTDQCRMTQQRVTLLSPSYKYGTSSCGIGAGDLRNGGPCSSIRHTQSPSGRDSSSCLVGRATRSFTHLRSNLRRIEPFLYRVVVQANIQESLTQSSPSHLHSLQLQFDTSFSTATPGLIAFGARRMLQALTVCSGVTSLAAIGHFCSPQLLAVLSNIHVARMALGLRHLCLNNEIPWPVTHRNEPFSNKSAMESVQIDRETEIRSSQSAIPAISNVSAFPFMSNGADSQSLTAHPALNDSRMRLGRKDASWTSIRSI